MNFEVGDEGTLEVRSPNLLPSVHKCSGHLATRRKLDEIADRYFPEHIAVRATSDIDNFTAKEKCIRLRVIPFVVAIDGDQLIVRTRGNFLGQLNTYVSWYKKNVLSEGDNPPIGILLCTRKNHALVEYALAGMDNSLFVSKYQLVLPDKGEMQRFLENSIRDAREA